ncbi:MAG TPA: RIP metalloprotease RseP [Patescibacteria group bacterium]|jgi:regulator of sigma E protease|nr:RIP metalloprotease RseP [Patescibacteria group bacterium]
MPDPLTLLGFIFILGALIFIHESGHYMVAKSLGIKVEVFSLGFGPRLLGFQKGGTDYRLSLLPVGGYVKMLGENPDEELRGNHEEFLSRSKFERFLVLVMGATLNIVLAVALTAALFVHGMPEPLFLTQQPVVGAIDPNAAAAEAGLRIGDTIVGVDGKEIRTWREMQLQIALNPDKQIDFSIQRDGKTLLVPVKVRATAKEQIGIIGIGPQTPLLAALVEPGSPADVAGLKAGDTVDRIDGEALTGYDSFQRTVAANAGKPLRFTVSRGDGTLDLTVTPSERDGKGYVGVTPSFPMGLRKYGPVEAMSQSLKVNWQQSSVLFLTLKKLVSGQLSPRTLSGPIDIYKITGESMRGGFGYYIQFMALVSLQLGIINLLPIPVLDGGHVFILLIEGLIRRDLSMKIKERVMQFGFILLLLIMGGVLTMDVYKNFFIQ